MVRTLPTVIILLGPPGAGKGTQGELISQRLNIPIISTGNMIREALKNVTPMGLAAKEFINKGQLLSDNIVIGIVKERISEKDCERGYILDGFPRTISQAEALEKMGIKISKVINIEVSDELINSRMSGRRICKDCQTPYNINTEMKPNVEGICDKCTGSLVQRDDDKSDDVVKERLKVYREQTAPLIDYYKKSKKLLTVDGHKPAQNVTNEIIGEIEA